MIQLVHETPDNEEAKPSIDLPIDNLWDSQNYMTLFTDTDTRNSTTDFNVAPKQMVKQVIGEGCLGV